MQETLISNFESIREFQSRWSGPSFWSPALGKQGRVAIFVQGNSRFDILNWQKDSSGRIVSLLVKVDDVRFNLVNIYAPTNPTERKEFFFLTIYMNIFIRIVIKLLPVILIAMKVQMISLAVISLLMSI